MSYADAHAVQPPIVAEFFVLLILLLSPAAAADEDKDLDLIPPAAAQQQAPPPSAAPTVTSTGTQRNYLEDAFSATALRDSLAVPFPPPTPGSWEDRLFLDFARRMGARPQPHADL